MVGAGEQSVAQEEKEDEEEKGKGESGSFVPDFQDVFHHGYYLREPFLL